MKQNKVTALDRQKCIDILFNKEKYFNAYLPVGTSVIITKIMS